MNCSGVWQAADTELTDGSLKEKLKGALVRQVRQANRDAQLLFKKQMNSLPSKYSCNVRTYLSSHSTTMATK